MHVIEETIAWLKVYMMNTSYLNLDSYLIGHKTVDTFLFHDLDAVVRMQYSAMSTRHHAILISPISRDPDL